MKTKISGEWVERGVYRHYKNGNFYRALTCVPVVLNDLPDGSPLVPDEEVAIVISEEFDYAYATRNSTHRRQSSAGHPAFDGVLMLAISSGNEPISSGKLVVLYVAIYGDARLSIRPTSEFSALVEPVGAKQKGLVPRFAWVGR
jgi:hypothetical protein